MLRTLCVPSSSHVGDTIILPRSQQRVLSATGVVRVNRETLRHQGVRRAKELWEPCYLALSSSRQIFCLGVKSSFYWILERARSQEVRSQAHIRVFLKNFEIRFCWHVFHIFQ